MITLEHDDRFAETLEACCRRVRGGESLDQCLVDYPTEYRQELARLIPLASRLDSIGHDPSLDFQARLEQRLLAAVDETRRTRRGLLERFGAVFTFTPVLRVATVALVVLLVLVGGGVGVVQASAESLPDSPLYRVKEARESVDLLLARNDETRVGVHARQIAERGRELERAVHADKPTRVMDVLALRLAWSTDRIVDQALRLQAHGNPRPAARALAMVRTMQRHVDRLAPEASPPAKLTLQRLHAFLEQQEERLLDQQTRERNPGEGQPTILSSRLPGLDPVGS